MQVTTMNKKQIELEHDKLLDISNVESYTNPNVNNEKLLFSDFVNRLQSPKITDKKGSAGGFVGGWIENTRENKNVQTRSMITIDIDDGMDTTKVWGNVEDYTNFSCVMYSTHNSQLSEPRYRLIIPLKHPIKPELYKSVSRYIVDVMQLGVDPSSHTLSQLMNYPTCGDISQYEFYYRDCPLFDANEVSEETLKKYSEKPANNKPVEDIPQTDDDERLLMKIRNTKVKVDARDFPVLFDKGDISNYESASHADYALAKILAKHTGNIDQIERLMRNSALYRPEKWDKHKKYLREFTINEALQKVKGGYGIKSSPEDDFQLFVNNKEKISLVLTEKGKVQKLLSNLKEILKHEDKLNGVGFNEFTQEVTINDEPITDEFISDLRLVIDSKFMITFTKDDVTDMVGSIARERNSYHPIKRYIESIEWDGKPRAEKIFIDYLGADNVSYTRSVTKKWLTGAVARIYEPGVKMEMVPVLQGKQGIGKSTLPSKLGDEFFVDTLASMGNTKDDYQLLIGSWIIELAELSSLNSSETEKIKSFISARFDKLRLPYGKIPQKYNRTCVFIGTTNNSQYLNDLTGNRRFFPIPLENEPKKDVFAIEDETIQQIWAESLTYYKQGEKLFLDSEDDEAMAEMYRSQAEEESLFFMSIDDFLNMKVPKDWDSMSLSEKKYRFELHKNGDGEKGTHSIDKTTKKEIAYMLGMDSKDRNANPQMKKINLYMDNLDGWKKQTVRINGESKKGFSRKTQ